MAERTVAGVVHPPRVCGTIRDDASYQQRRELVRVPDSAIIVNDAVSRSLRANSRKFAFLLVELSQMADKRAHVGLCGSHTRGLKIGGRGGSSSALEAKPSKSTS